ncbi:cytochrome P450 [Streptomyces sp. NPDC020681]|uniref:cytochrome P450 n=1 Tax=Streptomyces sp. NPDC020681 TaxID=3365083 RepID=UPI00378DC959
MNRTPSGPSPHPDLHSGPGLHQRLAALRQQGPVVPARLHGRLPVWVVTTADAVAAALTDPRLSSDDRWLHTGNAPPGEARSSVKLSIMGLEGLDHERVRRIIGRPFSRPNVDRQRPRIQHLTDTLVERVAQRLDQGETVDLAREVALPLPLHITGDMIGLTATERDGVHRLVRRQLDPGAPPEVREDARRELRGCIDHLIGRSHAVEGTLAGALADGRLTRAEAVDAGVLLLVAGYETSAALLASTLLTLLDPRSRYQALSRDPALVPRAVEEVLRMQGPVAIGVTRYTINEVTLDGVRIPAGQRVLLSLGAADRDPDRCPHPDRYDPTRTPQRTFALGHGRHYCLGAHLARLQVTLAVAALTRRVPRLTLAEPADQLPQLSGVFHGPARLPVRTTTQ